MIIIISLILSQNLILTLILTLGFLFSGFMFGPDLDIYSVQYQRWKWLRFIWLPYQKIFKHRSFFSHGFVIGTSIRVFYLSLIIGITSILLIGICQAIWGFHWNWHEIMISFSRYIKNYLLTEFISLYLGLELGAMSHYLADHLDSFFKYRIRSQKKSNSSHNKTRNKKKSKKRSS